MKRLSRLPLSSAAEAFLDLRSRTVGGATDAKSEAARLWKLRDHPELREIRATLERMASGIRRCMYCEDGRGTHIDHFWPKAAYPDRAFSWLNYLLACEVCNSNYKRDRFPLDDAGQPLLIDPTAEEPLDHLRLTPTSGTFVASSHKGCWSIQVFGLNRGDLEEGRKDAWQAAQGLLVLYANERRKGRHESAAKIEQAARRHPFSAVLAALIRTSRGPAAADQILPDCLAAIESCPEILAWD